MDGIFTFAIYFFGINFLSLFGIFFFKNDMAARFLFKMDLNAALNSSSQELKEMASAAAVFHRMECSFGAGIGAAVIAITAISSSPESRFAVLASIAFISFLLTVNHFGVYAGKAKFAPNVPKGMHQAINVMRFMALVMFLGYSALAVLAYKNLH